MLLDLLHLLTTPAPAAQRRLGYLRDSVWLMSRARRCRRAWAPHLEASRAVMRAAIAATERGDTAVVLGSGLLLDVPLADLAARFRRVVLVDAVHLRPARRAIRAFANVETLTADLSGAVALMTGAARDLEACLPPVCTEPGTGLVISANLLSQLPIRPVERLEASRHPLGAWTPEHGDAFGRRIVEGHLKALAGLRARVCLVTDIDETEEDRQGRVHVRHDLLYGARLGNPEREWTWELAPFGEAARNRRLIHRVVAFSDWHG